MDLSWLTVVVAVFVAYIAWQQKELAKDRLKLDLFDKRFVVYQTVKNALSEMSKMRESDVQFFLRFRRDTQDGLFLFDQSVEDYIAKIEDLILDYDRVLSELEGDPSTEDKRELQREKRELLNQAQEESKTVRDAFAPYLKFERWSKT